MGICCPLTPHTLPCSRNPVAKRWPNLLKHYAPHPKPPSLEHITPYTLHPASLTSDPNPRSPTHNPQTLSRSLSLSLSSLSPPGSWPVPTADPNSDTLNRTPYIPSPIPYSTLKPEAETWNAQGVSARSIGHLHLPSLRFGNPSAGTYT